MTVRKKTVTKKAKASKNSKKTTKKVAKKASSTTVSKRGPKTKYKKEYCNELILHMKKGLSLRAFCGAIGVHHSTVYDWLEKHPEFKEARDIGWDMSRLFWEQLGIDLATGEKKGNVMAWMVNMFNRFSSDWKRNDTPSDDKPQNIKLELAYKSYKKGKKDE